MNIGQIRKQTAGVVKSRGDSKLRRRQIKEDSSEGEVVDIQIQSPVKQMEEEEVAEETQTPLMTVSPQKEIIQIAFDGFDKAFREFASLALIEQLGAKIVGIPSKLTMSSKSLNDTVPALIIIVSEKGVFTKTSENSSYIKAIVNKQWVIECIERKSMVHEVDQFGFVFEGNEFFIIESEESELQNEAIKQKIKRNQGLILVNLVEILKTKKQPTRDQFIVLVSESEGIQTAKREIGKIVKSFKITQDQFNKLKILSSSHIELSILNQEPIQIDTANLANLFKMAIQGDTSIFSHKEEKKTEQVKRSKLITFEDLIEDAKSMPFREKNYLDGVAFHLCEEERKNDLLQVCEVTGSSYFTEIVPNFTTHVIANKLSRDLKSQIQRHQAKGMIDNKRQRHQAPQMVEQQAQFKLVTFEWAVECLRQKTKVSEEGYEPKEEVIDDSEVQQDKIKACAQKDLKSRIFKQKVFAINRESYPAGSEQLIDKFERIILENGGLLVDAKEKQGNFILQGDNFKDKSIENDAFFTHLDPYSRIVIHERWLNECINKKILIEKLEMKHLYPFPYKLPLSFAKEYSLYVGGGKDATEKDAVIKIASLLGFKTNSGSRVEGNVIMILLNADDGKKEQAIKNSATLKSLIQAKTQQESINLEVVHMGWLVNQMINEKQPCEFSRFRIGYENNHKK